MYDIPLLILLLVCFAVRNFAFSGRTTRMRQVSAAAPARMGLENSMGLLAKSNDEKEMDPLTKASWYGVELFGKVFGGKVKQNDATSEETINLDTPPQSIQETLERIQLDNDRSYFLSGNVDTLIYDEDCVFADPFVSFRGRDRFVDNLQNLGSFITKYSAKMLDYTQDENTVKTRVMVKLELNLPWKPVLAWPWGVTYDIDPVTFLVTKHEEAWDIEPLEGVKQIFRKPTTQIKE
jgi:hypothetical protein